jgi:hypothetical protein
MTDMQRLWDEQYPEFIKDHSYFVDYEGWRPKENHAVVRFFVLRKKTTIIVKDNMSDTLGKEIAIPTNFAMVILSDIDGVNVGDIVEFPFTETAGTVENPKMKAYIESAGVKGATPVLPLDQRERIGALEYNHKRKMVMKPGNVFPQGDDFYTFSFSKAEMLLVNTPK